MKDHIHHPTRRPSPLPTIVYIVLRTFDLYLQHHLLTSPAADAFLRTVVGLPISPYHSITTQRNLWAQTPTFALHIMTVGIWAKQIYALLFVVHEPLRLSSALYFALYNTVLNTANTILYLTNATSSLLSVSHIIIGRTQYPTSVVYGFILYTAGLATELYSEIQRRNFKSRHVNDDKAVQTGLWARARHINYVAHSVWRAGYALAASGWKAALVVFVFHVGDFAGREGAVTGGVLREDAWEPVGAV